MNLNGLNMEYLAHHILKQSGILERMRTPKQNRGGRSPSGRGRFALSCVEDCLIPDRLIPNTCPNHSPSPIYNSLKHKMSVGRLDIVLIIPEAKRVGLAGEHPTIPHPPFTIPLNQNMSVGRLELPTNGLKGHCSTIELHAHNQAIIVARDGMSVNEKPADF